MHPLPTRPLKLPPQLIPHPHEPNLHLLTPISLEIALQIPQRQQARRVHVRGPRHVEDHDPGPGRRWIHGGETGSGAETLDAGGGGNAPAAVRGRGSGGLGGARVVGLDEVEG